MTTKTLISDDSIARGLTLNSSFYQQSQSQQGSNEISDESLVLGLIATDDVDSAYAVRQHVQNELFLDEMEESSGAVSASLTTKQRQQQANAQIRKYQLQVSQANTKLNAHRWVYLSSKIYRRQLEKYRKIIFLDQSDKRSRAASRQNHKSSLLNIIIPELSEIDSPMNSPLIVPTPDSSDDHEECDLVLFQPHLVSQDWLQAASPRTCGNGYGKAIQIPVIFQDLLDTLPQITTEEYCILKDSQEMIEFEATETY
jgi:hypothetical protein